jgi:hypothetical protein
VLLNPDKPAELDVFTQDLSGIDIQGRGYFCQVLFCLKRPASFDKNADKTQFGIHVLKDSCTGRVILKKQHRSSLIEISGICLQNGVKSLYEK